MVLKKHSGGGISLSEEPHQLCPGGGPRHLSRQPVPSRRGPIRELPPSHRQADSGQVNHRRARSESGAPAAYRARCTFTASLRAITSPMLGQPSAPRAGVMRSNLRRPETSRAAKCMIFCSRSKRDLEAPPQTDEQYWRWGKTWVWTRILRMSGER